MSSIVVKTPDGVARQVERGTRALDVLKEAGSLNNQVIAAKAGDRLIDLGRGLDADQRPTSARKIIVLNVNDDQGSLRHRNLE